MSSSATDPIFSATANLLLCISTCSLAVKNLGKFDHKTNCNQTIGYFLDAQCMETSRKRHKNLLLVNCKLIVIVSFTEVYDD